MFCCCCCCCAAVQLIYMLSIYIQMEMTCVVMKIATRTHVMPPHHIVAAVAPRAKARPYICVISTLVCRHKKVTLVLLYRFEVSLFFPPVNSTTLLVLL